MTCTTGAIVRAGLLVATMIGCAAKRAPAPPHGNIPESPELFELPQPGFAVTIPAGWERRATADYVLEIFLAGEHAKTAPRISIDVPHLPPHLPGMIRMSLVRNGFLDDLRRQFPGVRVVDEQAVSIPDSQVRRIDTEWTLEGAAVQQRAVLIIRGGHVYIVRGTARQVDSPQMREAFEELMNSLHWTR